MNIDTTERLLTENEAADYLRLKAKTLQNLRLIGGGAPFVKLGRSVRYRLSDLRQFVGSNVRSSTVEAKTQS